MKKKVLSLGLAATMVLSLTACGNGGDKNANADADKTGGDEAKEVPRFDKSERISKY